MFKPLSLNVHGIVVIQVCLFEGFLVIYFHMVNINWMIMVKEFLNIDYYKYRQQLSGLLSLYIQLIDSFGKWCTFNLKKPSILFFWKSNGHE